MPDIRGLIFDLDGVIADTAEFHYRAWQRLADEENIAFSRDKYLRMSGTRQEENLRIFTENLAIDEATKTAWMQRKQGYFAEMRDTLQPADAMPGITRLLDEAKLANISVAVASSSRNTRPVLERLNLLSHFKIIGDGYTVVNSKPAPDIFIWVAGGLGLLPHQCLVLEDSPAGVEAALTGGFYVIALGTTPLANAHAQLLSLVGISLEALFNLLPPSP